MQFSHLYTLLKFSGIYFPDSICCNVFPDFLVYCKEKKKENKKNLNKLMNKMKMILEKDIYLFLFINNFNCRRLSYLLLSRLLKYTKWVHDCKTTVD